MHLLFSGSGGQVLTNTMWLQVSALVVLYMLSSCSTRSPVGAMLSMALYMLSRGVQLSEELLVLWYCACHALIHVCSRVVWL